MITPEEFITLGCGSVLRFDRSRNRPPVFRTVIVGPADHLTPSIRDCLTLPIMCRSWTRRGSTVINIWDVNGRGGSVATKRNRDLMTKEEIARLLNWCDTPSKLIDREIKERRFSNRLANPLALCRKLRDMRNALRWASI